MVINDDDIRQCLDMTIAMYIFWDKLQDKTDEMVTVYAEPFLVDESGNYIVVAQIDSETFEYGIDITERGYRFYQRSESKSNGGHVTDFVSHQSVDLVKLDFSGEVVIGEKQEPKKISRLAKLKLFISNLFKRSK